MPKLFYIARDKAGKRITGYEDLATTDELATRLQAKGLVVINIIPEYKEEKGVLNLEVAKQGKVRFRHYRITTGDLTLFCRQLATLLGAGVTILKTLDIISQQIASRKLYNVIRELQKSMEQGLSFHEAMAHYPEVFPELWINLVESGEASGNLAMILERLANYLERNAAFKAKIVSALIYPLLLMVVGFAALLFLTIKIIPTFAELFKNFGNVKMPELTQALINISNFIRSKGIFILIFLGVFFWMFRRFVSSEEGRRQYERFKFRLPVFGDFFKALIIERFSPEMSTLVESGVPILYSLEISERSVNNITMGDIIRHIKEEVRQGKTLSVPLEESGFFDPMVTQMVTIGEEIGELSQMFKRINAFYQTQVETFLARFASMFEPFMLIFMGIVIGIMVIGMFLPIFQLSQLGGS